MPALIEDGTVWRKKITLRSNLRILFHIADDGLTTVVYMDMLDGGQLAAPGVVAARVQELPPGLGVVEHPPPARITAIMQEDDVQALRIAVGKRAV